MSFLSLFSLEGGRSLPTLTLVVILHQAKTQQPTQTEEQISFSLTLGSFQERGHKSKSISSVHTEQYSIMSRQSYLLHPSPTLVLFTSLLMSF